MSESCAVHQLSPENSAFTQLTGIAAYQTAVAQLLTPDSAPQASLGVVCLPSFDREWSLLIHMDSPTKFTAVLREPSDQIWQSFPEAEPKVTTTEASLPAAMARGAIEHVSDALTGVGYQSPMRSGTDGVTYHLFARQDGRLMAGSAWSPNPDTKIGHLVGIADTLRAYVASPASREAASVQFKQHTDWLTASPAPRDQAPKLEQIKQHVTKLVANHKKGVLTD